MKIKFSIIKEGSLIVGKWIGSRVFFYFMFVEVIKLVIIK